MPYGHSGGVIRPGFSHWKGPPGFRRLVPRPTTGGQNPPYIKGLVVVGLLFLIEIVFWHVLGIARGRGVQVAYLWPVYGIAAGLSISFVPFVVATLAPEREFSVHTQQVLNGMFVAGLLILGFAVAGVMASWVGIRVGF